MNQKMLQNANKITYLVKEYPDHKLSQIISLLGMPAIEINTGIWAAVASGLIEEPNPETGEVDLGKKVPTEWGFGPELDTLKEMLIFSFQELAKKETDLEENYLSNWTVGYPSHDVLIAIRLLLNEEKLAEYLIEDGDNTYTFYALFENRDKLWGRRQFKKDPLKAEGENSTEDINEVEEK